MLLTLQLRLDLLNRKAKESYNTKHTADFMQRMGLGVTEPAPLVSPHSEIKDLNFLVKRSEIMKK